MRVLAVVAGLATGLATSAASAAPPAAPTKDGCIAAFDQGQQSRTNGKLRDARAALLVCVQRSCPGVLRADCANVLREVENAQPTIVLKATDRSGHDLVDVSVEANGEMLAQGLDGRALVVDPGRLMLIFERPGAPPVTMDVVVGESEKRRVVTAVFGPAETGHEPLPPPPAPRAPSPPARTKLGWAVPSGLAGLGLVALGIAGIRRIDLGNEADDLRASCGLSCSDSDRDRLSSELVTTNVILGVGIGALTLATVAWFLLGPSPAARSALVAP